MSTFLLNTTALLWRKETRKQEGWTLCFEENHDMAKRPCHAMPRGGNCWKSLQCRADSCINVEVALKSHLALKLQIVCFELQRCLHSLQTHTPAQVITECTHDSLGNHLPTESDDEWQIACQCIRYSGTWASCDIHRGRKRTWTWIKWSHSWLW